MTTPAAPSTAELRERLALVMARDQKRLRRRLDGLKGMRGNGERAAALAAIAEELAAAEAKLERRRASVPAIRYPDTLPISARTDDIVAALEQHQVVVVAGETGSGKSTQLPKICLEMGRGVRGPDRPHPAPPSGRPGGGRAGRRGAGRRGRRDGRLHGPLHRPGRRPDAREGDDRRDPPGRDPARPDAPRVRHDHRRRGPRAEPQHRLPARLPQAAAAAPARPQAHHHVGDDRHRALRGPLRRRPHRRGLGPRCTPSRSATGRSAKTPTTTATRSRRSATPSRSCGPRDRATSSCS